MTLAIIIVWLLTSLLGSRLPTSLFFSLFVVFANFRLPLHSALCQILSSRRWLETLSLCRRLLACDQLLLLGLLPKLDVSLVLSSCSHEWYGPFHFTSKTSTKFPPILGAAFVQHFLDTKTLIYYFEPPKLTNASLLHLFGPVPCRTLTVPPQHNDYKPSGTFAYLNLDLQPLYITLMWLLVVVTDARSVCLDNN
jgi:hypothetical protein